MKNKEPLRGLNLTLEGNPWGPKGSLQTSLRFPTPPRGGDDRGHVGRYGHHTSTAEPTERSTP